MRLEAVHFRRIKGKPVHFRRFAPGSGSTLGGGPLLQQAGVQVVDLACRDPRLRHEPAVEERRHQVLHALLGIEGPVDHAVGLGSTTMAPARERVCENALRWTSAKASSRDEPSIRATSTAV